MSQRTKPSANSAGTGKKHLPQRLSRQTNASVSEGVLFRDKPRFPSAHYLVARLNLVLEPDFYSDNQVQFCAFETIYTVCVKL